MKVIYAKEICNDFFSLIRPTHPHPFFLPLCFQKTWKTPITQSPQFCNESASIWKLSQIQICSRVVVPKSSLFSCIFLPQDLVFVFMDCIRAPSKRGREVSRAEGVDLPIAPEFWRSMTILFIINPSLGGVSGNPSP